MNITVNVLPMPVINKTIYACENEEITLASACPGGSSGWFWTGPGGSILPFSTSSIKVTAHHGNSYMVGTILPNGCFCQTVFTILSTPIPYLGRTVNIFCGDSLNLDTLAICNGFSTGWQNSSHITLPSSKVAPNRTTVYYRETHPSSSSPCINCVEELTVNVLPRPIDTVEISLCPNQDTLLDFACYGGTEYHLITPFSATLLYPPVSPISVSGASAPATYTLETLLPNGCLCTRVYILKPLQPWGVEKSVSAFCGDSLDLDTLGLCAGTAIWKDSSGNVLSSNTVRVSGNNTTKQYFGYFYSASGCLECVTKLNITSLTRATVYKSYTIDCRNDGMMIQPDCHGYKYEWHNHNTGADRTVNGGTGAISVGRSSNTQVFTVITYGADSCVCITEITVQTMVSSPLYYKFDVDLPCGNVLDLNTYNQCDTVSGTTSAWIDNGTYSPVPSTTITGGHLTNGKTFTKRVEDEYGCLKCVVTVTVHTNQNFVYYDQPVRYDVCVGAVVNPPAMCPGADHYEWYDDNGIILLATGSGITAVMPMSGIFLRYGYDANGCLLCIERVHIVVYTPLTEFDIMAMPSQSIIINCPNQFCRQMSLLPSYNRDFGPGVTCGWSPSGVSDYGNGDILVCPPYTSGTFVREDAITVMDV